MSYFAFFLFIYLIILTIIRAINFYSDNIIIQKISILVALVLFTLIDESTGCYRPFSDVMKRSFIMSLLGIIGYTIVLDLQTMEWSNSFYHYLYEHELLYNCFTVLIIVGFTSLPKILDRITGDVCFK